MARLATSLVVLRDEFDHAFPNRSKVSDGWIGDPAHASRASRHNPNHENVVTALDITHDPASGCDVHREARALVERAKRGMCNPNFDYVVSDSQIASRYREFWKWRPYSGSNKHTKHAHFAVGTGPDSDPRQPYDSPTTWGVNRIEDEMLTAPKDVAYFQRILKKKWPAPHDKAGPPYAIRTDGIIDAAVEAAVRDWQTRRGIEVTGTFNLATVSTLQSHANRAYATEQAKAN